MKYHALLPFVVAIAVTAGPTVLADDATGAENTTTKTVDPSGTWRWERERSGGEIIKNQLKIDVNEKDEIVATYSGMMDGLKSTKGSINGEKFVLDFDVDRDGYNFQVKYEGTVDQDKVVGTITLSNDEGTREFPWEAKRSVELTDVVGTWNLKLESPDGNVHEPSLTVTRTNEEVKAVYLAGDLGEFPVTDLTAKDNTFTFTIVGELNGTDFVAMYTTYPKGSKLSGETVIEMGEQVIEMKLSGTRAKSSSES